MRRRISKDAAKRLSDELGWAAEDERDAILSELILHAPRDLFHAAADCTHDIIEAAIWAGTIGPDARTALSVMAAEDAVRLGIEQDAAAAQFVARLILEERARRLGGVS